MRNKLVKRALVAANISCLLSVLSYFIAIQWTYNVMVNEHIFMFHLSTCTGRGSREGSGQVTLKLTELCVLLNIGTSSIKSRFDQSV